MLYPEPICRKIAKTLYKADCIARWQLINRFVDHNERSYMGALVGLATYKLWKQFPLRRLDFRLSARDKHTYDGLFVFRQGDKFRVGICESKLIRYEDQYFNEEEKERFGRQIETFSKWPDEVAKWYMFLLDKGYKQEMGENIGSCCIWHDDLIDFGSHNNPISSKGWGLKDLNKIEEKYGKKLKQMIYKMLHDSRYNLSSLILKTDGNNNNISFRLGRNKTVEIPIPKRPEAQDQRFRFSDATIFYEYNAGFAGVVQDFLKENHLEFYEYFELPDRKKDDNP